MLDRGSDHIYISSLEQMEMDLELMGDQLIGYRTNLDHCDFDLEPRHACVPSRGRLVPEEAYPVLRKRESANTTMTLAGQEAWFSQICGMRLSLRLVFGSY